MLRLNNGITTKSINIPSHCVDTEYRVPFHRLIVQPIVNSAQDLIVSKCLIFKWDRRSGWGPYKKIPIMDLVDIA